MAIKLLKNNKSHGIDNVLNEHLKSTTSQMLRLFNMIFDSRIIPESWAYGEILPIYKNKGDKSLGPFHF